jgi:hypothetical protein
VCMVFAPIIPIPIPTIPGIIPTPIPTPAAGTFPNANPPPFHNGCAGINGGTTPAIAPGGGGGNGTPPAACNPKPMPW